MSLTNKISPKLIISGAPASGKGTQCEYIKKEFNVIHLSTGDMLREAVNLKTNYGLEAKSYMDRGALVPDEIIINIVMARLAEDDCIQQGCLLDGFPRTPIQADTLIAAGFDCSAFIQLDVDDSMLVERVVGRRMDPITGKIYHLKYSPPPQDIISRLVHRSDDTEEKVVHRIAAYHENLNPILEKFQSKLLRLNGNRTPDQIWKDLRSRLPRRIKFEVIFVLGGPGSGKGTLCEKLSLQSGYEHLSAGDLLREELKSGSQYADMIRTISSQGGLVPAELVISLLSKAMYTIRNSSNGIKKKFLIDGFPRNFDNLVAWYNVMNDSCIVDFVLNLDCTEEVMKERILGRAKTSGRVDDNEETLVKRFHTFHQDTQPVLASFDRLGKLRTVDANLTPEYVLNESLQIVKSIQLIPPMTRTFAMIKPDALAKGVLSNIIDTIKSTGNLFIVMAKIIQFNSQVIEKFYSEHKNKSFFNNLKNFMSSGPSICLILEGVDAIRSWRTMMGPTDSNNAREIEPKSLRALYGTDSTMNAVHGSDSEFSAMREIDFIFSPSGEGISCQRNQILDINTNCLDDVFDSNNGNTSYVEYSFGGLILQETYAMIKPFTAEIYYDKIISIIKGHGFIITGEIKLQLTNDLAELFYQEHRGKGFFNNLIKYMTSRKIVGLKLKRNGAIYGWRNLMGPTDYIKACNERACDSIRALYATDGTKNAVHGSDSIISSQRELQFFFTIGRNELHEILPATSNSPTRPTLPPLLYHNNNNNNNSDNNNNNQLRSISPGKKPHRIPPMSRADAAIMQSYNLHEVNPVMGPLLSKLMISRPKNVAEFAITELKKIKGDLQDEED